MVILTYHHLYKFLNNVLHSQVTTSNQYAKERSSSIKETKASPKLSAVNPTRLIHFMH